jgi:hypothetical protein
VLLAVGAMRLVGAAVRLISGAGRPSFRDREDLHLPIILPTFLFKESREPSAFSLSGDVGVSRRGTAMAEGSSAQHPQKRWRFSSVFLLYPYFHPPSRDHFIGSKPDRERVWSRYSPPDQIGVVVKTRSRRVGPRDPRQALRKLCVVCSEFTAAVSK